MNLNRSIMMLILWTVCFQAATAFADNYGQVLDKMRTIASQYPQFAFLFPMGTNDDGKEIIAMRISIHPEFMDPEKIGHILVATHHGNEGKSTTLALAFIENLLEKYSSWELYRGNLSDIEWTIIPVLNIPGFNSNQRYENGKDPNRDYPGPCVSNPGGKLKSIRSLMAFLNTRIFSGSITVHGYIGTLTYPWGVSTTNTHTMDHNLFEQITAKAAQFNGYRYGTSTELIYPCNGSYEDYVYWKHGLWSLLVELRSGSASDISDTVKTLESFYDQLDSSPSTHNQMTGQCTRSRVPDLQNE